MPRPCPARPPTAPRTSFAPRSRSGALALLALGRPGSALGLAIMTVTVLVLRRAPAPAAAHLVFLVPLAIDVWLTATGSRWPTPRATGWRRSVGPVPRFVDLSAPIVPSPPDTPDALRTELEYAGHAEGAAQIGAMLGVGPELLRDGEGWAVETFLRLGTHSTTHVDAPWHYNSTIAGAPARRSTSCRSSGSCSPASSWTSRPRPTATRSPPPRSRRRCAAPATSSPPLHVVLVRTGRDRFLDDPGYPARGWA